MTDILGIFIVSASWN